MTLVLGLILLLAALGIYGLLELPNCAEVVGPQRCGTDPAAASVIFLARGNVTVDLRELALERRLVELKGGELVWLRPHELKVASQLTLKRGLLCSGKFSRRWIWIDTRCLRSIIRRSTT